MGRKETTQEFIESSRQAIIAGRTHEEIKSRLENFAYTETVRMVGESLLAQAELALDNQHSEKEESYGAYDTFVTVSDTLQSTYNLHKKCAQVAFKKDPEAKGMLLIDRKFPQSYANKMKTIHTFYNKLGSNESYLSAVAKFNMTAETVAEGTALHEATQQYSFLFDPWKTPNKSVCLALSASSLSNLPDRSESLSV